MLNNPLSDPVSWDNKSAWGYSAARDGSPGRVNPASAYSSGTVVVNEVLSHQDADNPGDWIELRNTRGAPIDLGGWFLSDSRGNLKKYAIPAGTTIPAYGYLVFTEYSHFGSAFALSEHGDSVYLSAGNGVALSEPAYRESVDFGGQVRDVTFGRHVTSDGGADFVAQTYATRSAANSGPLVGPVVFEEIMATWPDSFAARRQPFNIGLCHDQNGDIDSAVKAFQEQLNRFPDSYVAERAQVELNRIQVQEPDLNVAKHRL